MKQVIQFVAFASLTFFLQVSSFAQVVSDGNGVYSVYESGTISSFSVPANSNRLLIGCMTSTTAASMTFDGNAMTTIASNNEGGLITTAFYYALGTSATPTIGNIVGTPATANLMGASSFHNVDQTTPIDAGTIKINGSAGSLDVTSEVNDLVCDCLGSYNGGGANYSTTEGPGQTKIYGAPSGTASFDVQIASSHEAGSSSVQMSWTASTINSRHSHIGFNINAPASLPVALTSFEVKNMGKNIELNWQTASEENNKGFEVQKSINREDFETIGFVEGFGTTFGPQQYTYTDESPYRGINYFRLKQIDFDGQYEYSEVKSIEFRNGDLEVISVYPNPVQNTLTLSTTATIKEVIIRNVLGQPVKTVLLSEGQRELNVEELSEGTYYLQVVGKNRQLQIIPFVKK